MHKNFSSFFVRGHWRGGHTQHRALSTWDRHGRHAGGPLARAINQNSANYATKRRLFASWMLIKKEQGARNVDRLPFWQILMQSQQSSRRRRRMLGKFLLNGQHNLAINNNTNPGEISEQWNAAQSQIYVTLSLSLPFSLFLCLELTPMAYGWEFESQLDVINSIIFHWFERQGRLIENKI